MLPSTEFKALCEKETVVLVHAKDPACKALCGEFDVRWGNSHIVVLDGRGELLGGMMGDSVETGGCTEEMAAGFSSAVSGKIVQFLARRESCQELERRFRHAPDAAGLSAFMERLSEGERPERIVAICDEYLAACRGDPVLREELFVRRYLAKSLVILNDRDADAAAFEWGAEEGERLLFSLPAHARAEEVRMGVLCFLDGAFDGARKLPALCGKLEGASGTMPDGAARARHAKWLQERVDRQEEAFARLQGKTAEEDLESRVRQAVFSGDADAVIRMLSDPALAEFPRRKLLLEAARRHLAKQE